MATGTHVGPWWRVPRSHGVVVGILLLLLGLWGGLAPFIGPYLGYGFTPNTPWTFTWGRFWLEIVPAAVTIIAALALLFSGNRFTGVWMAWLAVLAGAWFVVGGPLSRLWNGGTSLAGTPTGGVSSQVFQQIGLFLGLGVVIVFLGGAAFARFAFAARGARRGAEPYAEPVAEEPAQWTEPASTGYGEPAAEEPAPAEHAAPPERTAPDERTETAERVPQADDERAR